MADESNKDRYVAASHIAGGYDEEKDEQVEFTPGEYVTGLTGDQMQFLWEQGSIVAADSDRAKAIRVEAGLEEGNHEPPKFGEIFSTESAPVDPRTGAQHGTSHPGTPFSSVDSKESTAASVAAKNAPAPAGSPKAAAAAKPTAK